MKLKFKARFKFYNFLVQQITITWDLFCFFSDRFMLSKNLELLYFYNICALSNPNSLRFI